MNIFEKAQLILFSINELDENPLASLTKLSTTKSGDNNYLSSFLNVHIYNFFTQGKYHVYDEVEDAIPFSSDEMKDLSLSYMMFHTNRVYKPYLKQLNSKDKIEKLYPLTQSLMIRLSAYLNERLIDLYDVLCPKLQEFCKEHDYTCPIEIETSNEFKVALITSLIVGVDYVGDIGMYADEKTKEILQNQVNEIVKDFGDILNGIELPIDLLCFANSFIMGRLVNSYLNSRNYALGNQSQDISLVESILQERLALFKNTYSQEDLNYEDKSVKQVVFKFSYTANINNSAFNDAIIKELRFAVNNNHSNFFVLDIGSEQNVSQFVFDGHKDSKTIGVKQRHFCTIIRSVFGGRNIISLMTDDEFLQILMEKMQKGEIGQNDIPLRLQSKIKSSMNEIKQFIPETAELF